MDTIQTATEPVRAEFVKDPNPGSFVEQVQRLRGEHVNTAGMVLQYLCDTELLARNPTCSLLTDTDSAARR